MSRLHAACLSILAATSLASAATTISSLPYNITSSGTYVLGANLTLPASASGSAIRIQASNVTLDLNGFCLKGKGASADTGILVARQKNVVVKNGTVTNFLMGVGMLNIQLDTNHRFQDLQLLDNTTSLLLTGSNHVVRNVQIAASSQFSWSGAVFLSAKSCLLEGVDILGPGKTSNYNGIMIWGWHNRIRNSRFTDLDIAVYADNGAGNNGQWNVVENSYFTNNGSVYEYNGVVPHNAFYGNVFSSNTSDLPLPYVTSVGNNSF